jgi:NADPH2:quinone reductase
VTSGDAAISLSPFRIYNDEITVLGSMAVLNSFGAAADLMAEGAISTGPLLGQPYRLGEFAEALAAVRNGEGIKIQVTPGR